MINIMKSIKVTIDTILNEGADKARYMARKKLAKVERKIGITIKK